MCNWETVLFAGTKGKRKLSEKAKTFSPLMLFADVITDLGHEAQHPSYYNKV